MRPPRLSLLAAPLLTLVLLAVPASALGAANHPFLTAINGGYEDACGVARFGGGLYVSDYYHNALDLPSGKISPESKGSGPCKIELDAAGDLYVDDWHEKVVKYNSGELLPGTGTVIDSANPTGLAVEGSSGDLFVAHRTYVSKYSSAGTLLQTIGTGDLEEGYGVAVSEYPATAGDIYVPDAATHTVKVFDAAGALIEEMDGAATPQGHFTYFTDGEIALDNIPGSPSYGHVFVLDAIGHGLSTHPAAAVDEFNAEGDYRGQITGFTDAEPSGIAIDPGSHNVYITSGNSEGSDVFEYGPTFPARTLKVIKEGTGGGTVTTAPLGIACGSACVAEYDESKSVTLFAFPDAHSVFSGWSVVGSEPCPGTGSCTASLANDVEVHANFTRAEQKSLTVNISSEGTVKSEPAGISCPTDCAEEFSVNRLVTLTASPVAHHELIGWSGCDSVPSPSECKVTMSQAKVVSVTFAPIPQLSLSVVETGTGQGAVTSYPTGISCPGICSSSFDEGSTVYLMAAPSPGSGFGGFSGGSCEGTATLCAVTMSSASEVRAHFAGAASGPAPTAGARPGGSFSLAASRTTAAGALLTVKVPEAGTLLVSGSGLRPAKRGLSAGTSRVRVALGRRARRFLSAHHRLRLRIAIGFLPSGGGAPAATAATLRFRSPAGKAAVRRRKR